MQISKEIFDRLDAIGAKLGVAANHLWPALIKQAYMDGVRDSTVAGVFLILVGASGLLVRYGFKQEDEDAFIAGNCFAVLFLLLFAVWAYPAIGELCNPEFYALKILRELVK